ncbi:MAG: ribonuclease P protein component 1, partial [Candidatus Micrarchaeia archaeon]
MIDRNNILIHELIGLEAEVLSSTCKNLAGMRGRVVNETKNTLEVEKGRDVKVIPKKIAMFRFYLPNGEFADVDGKLIQHNPEDRPKKLLKYVRKV